MKIDFAERVYAGWAGKCLGGAIGMAYEGVPYRPQLSRDSIHVMEVPNDDLELQMVWLLGLERHGLTLSHEHFADFWTEEIQHGCDEYSVAIYNMNHGIMPPESGRTGNYFRDGMGAAIRSEIWAMAFAGRPDAAAHFAMLDASVDHWGDGVWAEIFMAVLECHVLGGETPEQAIFSAMKQLPHDCRLKRALDSVITLYRQGADRQSACDQIRNEWYHFNFTDCVMNLAFIVYALLWGNGDFIETVLAAIHCGRDTDCTAASCGAIIAMAYGRKGIPAELLEKLGDTLILSPYIKAISGVPESISELVERTLAVQKKLSASLTPATYPAYQPSAVKELQHPYHSTWLLLENLPSTEADQLEAEILAGGKCPERLQDKRMTFHGFQGDLTPFAGKAGTLDLFAFLEVSAPEETVGQAVLSATADVGMTLWVDGRRVMNHHSRQISIPSFHRAEGGAAFAMPLTSGARKLFHLRFYSCLPPMVFTVMFGNLYNDHLDGFDFSI